MLLAVKQCWGCGMGNVVRAEFGRPMVAQAAKGERVADCDDGYTRLANELFDEIIGSDLTRNQMKVALAVARKTFGFNKKADRISDSQLVELTKLPRQKVNPAKNALLDMRVLVMDGRKIGVNKNLSEWKTDCHRNSDNVTKTVTKNVTKTVTEVSPKQGHTKDTIQKTRKTKSKSICAEPAAAASAPVVVEGVLVDDGDRPVEPEKTRLVANQTTPAQLPNEPVAILLPLNTGEGYPVTCAFADQMRSLYPAVDVSQELRAMCGWLIGNPAKRKTKRGVVRFITSWLARCQDRGGSSGLTQAYQQPAWTLDVNDTSWTKYLQEGF